MAVAKKKLAFPFRLILLVGAIVGAIMLFKRNRNDIEKIAEKIDDEADETIEKLEAAIAKAKHSKK